MMTEWAGRSVLVTGGAGFIGSHVVDALVARGARVRVADDLSSGSRENIERHLRRRTIAFHEGDLREPSFARRAVAEQGVVLHLAARPGNDGASAAANLALDGAVFEACLAAGVERLLYASAATVYPRYLADGGKERPLSEEMAGPPYDPDEPGGWTKLAGERTVAALAREGALRAATVRVFATYGERAPADHPLNALIAQALAKSERIVLDGSGREATAWAYAGDVVAGILVAAERIDDGTAVNAGATERTEELEAAREVLAYTGLEAALVAGEGEGAPRRFADVSRARSLLGWEPRTPFVDGLRRTIDWYFAAYGDDATA